MADHTDIDFSDLLSRLKYPPAENRTSDLLNLLKTLLTKNVTVQDWNTLIRTVAPLYEAMLTLNDCMTELIPMLQEEFAALTGAPCTIATRVDNLEQECTELDSTKFDKAGGKIDGSVDITGNLTVRGTSTEVDTEHLRVKDAVIETNVDAKTAEDIPDLSGHVIHIGNDAAYGIVYDKDAQSVKLGLVEKGADGKYRFQTGEGQSVALRADTSDLVTGRLVVWNRDKNRFETSFQVAQDATGATVAQRNADGEVITAANPKSDSAAIPKGLFDTTVNTLSEGLDGKLDVHPGDADGNYPFYPTIPMIARKSPSDKTHYKQVWEQLCIEAINNSIPKRTTYGAVQTKSPQAATDAVNLEYADGHYVAINIVTPKAIYAVDSNKNPVLLPFTMEPTANTMAQRAAGGVLRVGTPIADTDATPKKYVDDGFVQKQTTTDNASFVYAYDKNGDKTFQLTGAPNAGSVAFRGDGGVLKVGDPVALKDAVNLEYFTTRLNAVTGVSPYFTHNIRITQTVDNVVNTVRITLTCTKVTKFTTVSELREAIVQLGGDAENSNTPMWYGVCKMSLYTGLDDTAPDSITAYSGYIGLWNSPTLRAWGDSATPSTSYGVTLDDTNWTVSDEILNTVVGGTTA